MRTYTIHVAQYVRCYGTVTVEAPTPEAAIAQLDHDTIAAGFQNYGDREDMDLHNARQAHLSDWDDDRGRSGGIGIDLPDPEPA